VCVRVPAELTFPPNGETPNDKVIGGARANACLVDEIAASTDSVRIPATTTATITDIEINFCTICVKLLYIHNKWY
jgi:hypothetical protein